MTNIAVDTIVVLPYTNQGVVIAIIIPFQFGLESCSLPDLIPVCSEQSHVIAII